MTITFRIRNSTSNDLPALRELFLSARLQAFSWLPPGMFHLDDFDVQTEGERILVAESTGRIAGFVSVWEPDHFIHHLFVDVDYLRQGIGRALLRALPEWPERHYRLKCLDRNRTALAFYRAQGFFEVGRGMGDEGEHVVLSLAPQAT